MGSTLSQAQLSCPNGQDSPNRLMRPRFLMHVEDDNIYLYISIYTYLYIEREREIYIYVYIYI